MADIKTINGNELRDSRIDNLYDAVNNLTDTLAEVLGRIAPAEPAESISMSDIYPIGAVYISFESTNPGTLFGGTWEQLKDRFLLGASTTYAVGSTGGEATHVLTIDEMPVHNHVYYDTYQTWSSGGDASDGGDRNSDHKRTTENAGGGKAHNNMPPYLAVYMWKRIG